MSKGVERNIFVIDIGNVPSDIVYQWLHEFINEYKKGELRI